ncbi:MAG: hypothetical protein AB1758_28690 [Candidatus Eremiobacterota bacterium]
MSEAIGQVHPGGTPTESNPSTGSGSSRCSDRIDLKGDPDLQSQQILDLRRRATEMGIVAPGTATGVLPRPVPEWERGGTCLRRLLVTPGEEARNGNHLDPADHQRNFFTELTRRTSLSFNEAVAAPLEWPGLKPLAAE